MSTNRPRTSRDPMPRYETALCQAAFEAIAAHEGTICTVYYTKRTTSEKRRMMCIYNSTAAAKAQFGFNPAEKSLLPVLDCECGEPRMISLDAVHRVIVNGETVYPTPEETPLPKTLAEADAEMRYLFG